MTGQLTWLAGALRTAGLNIVEIDGWQERGRGKMGDVKGVLLHHTAGPPEGLHPSLNVVLNGRADLPGPLSQLFLDRAGTFHIVAAGKCNHAGKGNWHGITDGNSHFIGIEAENPGTGSWAAWPHEQMHAYIRGVGALLTFLGEDSVMAVGHKEYALPRGRKIDPSFDMVQFREEVDRVMVPAGPGQIQMLGYPVAAEPKRSMLRKGDQGNSVRLAQEKLKIVVDGFFGPATDKAVRDFQKANGLIVDGLVGPATWEALGVS